jgi:hypothetical protein
MLMGHRSRVTPPQTSLAVAAGRPPLSFQLEKVLTSTANPGVWLLLALATGCAGVGQEGQAPQRSASFGVSHDEAAFLLGFCRNLVSSTSPEAKSGQDDLFKYGTALLRFRFAFFFDSQKRVFDSFNRAVAGGDIVFNVTIDAPALTLPNMQLTAHNFDVVQSSTVWVVHLRHLTHRLTCRRT